MDEVVSGEPVRWLSYAAAAQELRVEPESIRRRAMRAGWKRQQGNDGKTLVAVPLDALRDATRDIAGNKARHVAGEQAGRDITGDVAGDVAGQEAARLREALARAEATTDGLRDLVQRLEADRTGLAQEVAKARQEARDALAQLQGAEVARAGAEARVRALEEVAERRRSSLLGRLLGW